MFSWPVQSSKTVEFTNYKTCSEITGDLDELAFAELIAYIYVGESLEVENLIAVLKLSDETW